MCNFLTLNLKDEEKTGEMVSQLSDLANLYHSYHKPSVSTRTKQDFKKVMKKSRNSDIKTR